MRTISDPRRRSGRHCPAGRARGSRSRARSRRCAAARRAVRQATPMVDRSVDSALELDIGPLLDALDPYSPRGRRMTLRELGRRDDPDFDRRLRASIYRGSARAAATLDAMATAAPSIRRSLRELEASHRHRADRGRTAAAARGLGAAARAPMTTSADAAPCRRRGGRRRALVERSKKGGLRRRVR